MIYVLGYIHIIQNIYCVKKINSAPMQQHLWPSWLRRLIQIQIFIWGCGFESQSMNFIEKAFENLKYFYYVFLGDSNKKNEILKRSSITWHSPLECETASIINCFLYINLIHKRRGRMRKNNFMSKNFRISPSL